MTDTRNPESSVDQPPPPPPPPSPPPPPPPPPPLAQVYIPGPYGYSPPARINGLAVAGMVLGIVWIYWITSILAVIFGHIALNQMKKNPGMYKGRGMAIAAVVLGWIWIGFLLSIVVTAILGGFKDPVS